MNLLTYHIRFILLVLLVCLPFSSTPTCWAQELKNEIIHKIPQVPEFAFIQKMAKEKNVKAYLFGGTAAAYAHYVKWDLMRRNGDTTYQADRFDYDYSNIFRSNQDMDIVIDGDAQMAQDLEQELSAKFPFFQGQKSVWEVRLLKNQLGDKEALLDNPHFSLQHTDSHSTGLIELTGNNILDLRDFKNTQHPQFLEDVTTGTLHYYYSSDHSKTHRYQQGLNPPIFSVIRYLTKAFQYELTIPSESLINIQKIIRDFRPNRETKNPYVKNWLQKNAIKLLQNAVNIEYAWNTLEQLGLRNQLAQVDLNEKGPISWWMNKEPLRSRPLGQGRGKTAQELGITRVAHETNSFDAYESITKAHTGNANVFISRQGQMGEAAIYGNGFYTAIGTIGARGSGLTIRFIVAPEAREGRDFFQVKDQGYVVFLNKNALTVIPEDLKLGPIEYFKLLADGFHFDHNDKAVKEKVRRKIKNSIFRIGPSEERDIANSVLEKLAQLPDEDFQEKNVHWTTLVNEFIEIFPQSKLTFDVVKMAFNKGAYDTMTFYNIEKMMSSWDSNQEKEILQEYFTSQMKKNSFLFYSGIEENKKLLNKLFDYNIGIAKSSPEGPYLIRQIIRGFIFENNKNEIIPFLDKFFSKRMSLTSEKLNLNSLFNSSLDFSTIMLVDGLFSYLVHQGLDPNTTDSSGRNFLHIYAKKMTSFDLLQYGLTKLDLAQIKSLVELGVDLNHQDVIGQTPFMYLWDHQRDHMNGSFQPFEKDVWDYFLAQKVNLNLQDKEGKSALYYALKSYNFAVNGSVAREEVAEADKKNILALLERGVEIEGQEYTEQPLYPYQREKNIFFKAIYYLFDPVYPWEINKQINFHEAQTIIAEEKSLRNKLSEELKQILQLPSPTILQDLELFLDKNKLYSGRFNWLFNHVNDELTKNIPDCPQLKSDNWNIKWMIELNKFLSKAKFAESN